MPKFSALDPNLFVTYTNDLAYDIIAVSLLYDKSQLQTLNQYKKVPYPLATSLGTKIAEKTIIRGTPCPLNILCTGSGRGYIANHRPILIQIH